MAEVIVHFDTVSKELKVTVDGAAVEDVSGVRINKRFYLESDGSDDAEQYCCCIDTVSKDEEHDLRTFTSLVASDSAAGKEAARRGEVASEVPGFVTAASRSKVEEDIADFFAR